MTAAGTAGGPTTWWWVRHAPIVEGPGRIHGQRDVPCDTSDHTRIRALAALLPSDATWIVTPLKRTRQTRDAIAAAAATPPPPPVIEPAFMEQDFGRWQGMTWSEMEAAEPDIYAHFWRTPTTAAPPGGESFAAVIRRTGKAIERLDRIHAGRSIVVIAHGGTIRAAVAHALGLTPDQAMAIIIDNLSVTRLARVEDGLKPAVGGVWRVHGLNASASGFA